MANTLGTTEPLKIEGIGYLQWSTKGWNGTPVDSANADDYSEKPGSYVGPGFFDGKPYVYYPTFKTPNLEGFSLQLALDEPYAESNLERYSRIKRWQSDEPITEHFGEDESNLRFPSWLITFANDLMDWTMAEEVWVMEEDVYPGENSKYIDIALDYNHQGRFGIEPGIPIGNPDVFIGTAALHLASLITS